MTGGTHAPRLTLCLIARNEAGGLGRALASAGRVADEIVVVDTGSDDHTIEVARAHGARVIEHPWGDDFAAARNAGLDAARGTWVLSLDADEILPAPTAARLHAALAHADAPALRVPIENVAATGALESVDLAVRLFRRDPALRWDGIVHERVTVVETADAALPILHHGWSESGTRATKLARNQALLERAVAGSPDDPHLLLHLARARLACGANTAAVATAERALAIDSARGDVGLLLLDTLAMARAACGRLDPAADVCRIALALRPAWIDPRLLLAQVSRRAGRAREAALHLERWLTDRRRLVDDVTWPARFPRLRTYGAEAAVRAELAMVVASLGALSRGCPELRRAKAPVVDEARAAVEATAALDAPAPTETAGDRRDTSAPGTGRRGPAGVP